jgi:pyruvate kinase
MIHKNTKIVCTLGPASENVHTIEKMILAGMNVARLNFSHGDYSEFARLIRNIRAASKKLGVPIAIMQDLQGPKIRVGEMPEKGISIKKNEIVILTTSNVTGVPGKIPVQYKGLPQDVRKNDRILIDDGLLELHVLKIKGHDITCRVINSGTVYKHKGINVPTASISANPITSKDKQDLAFALENDVDYVALSFVKSPKNIIELRELIRRKHGQAKIIAKIERHEAVDNLESIIQETDGVMVARGDLGVEVPAETVPLIQKRMIHLANIHGKPVITATQILQSMVENPRPTRAEISDAANAIFDHSDALMLSNESAVGKYPVEATHTLAKVATSVEQFLKKHKEFLPNLLFHENMPVSYATCLHGTKLAMDIGARLIVAVTYSGFTAQHVAKHRSYIPIIAITEDKKVQQQLALVWGINRVFTEKLELKNCPHQTRKLLLKHNLAKKGDKIVIISNASKEDKHISVITV